VSLWGICKGRETRRDATPVAPECGVYSVTAALVLAQGAGSGMIARRVLLAELCVAVCENFLDVRILYTAISQHMTTTIIL
jgi:hypothetical protein